MFNSKISFAFWFFASQLICLQTFAQTVIDNIQTANYVVLAGTKYAIVPPANSFKTSKQGTALVDEQLEAGITFMEMPMDYETTRSMFSIAKDGKSLMEKNLVMNGYQAQLVKVKHTNKETYKVMILWQLLYGNKELTININAGYAENLDKEWGVKFEKSLLSFLYLASQTVNPLDGLQFTVDASNSTLKFAEVMLQTGAVFTTDGKLPSELSDKTSFMVLVMPLEIETNEQANTAQRNVKKITDKYITLSETKPITIDGLQGYEVIGQESEPNQPIRHIYCVTLFEKNQYFMLRGATAQEVEKNMSMLKQIVKSFKLKKN